jgi:hypothetical protein
VNRVASWVVPILACLMWVSGCSSSSGGGGSNTPAVESITATSGTSQSAATNTAFAAPLVATVTKGGLPVSGVVVTFTPPATGASATFAGGANSATTNSSGVATSAAISANGTAGGPYTVMAAVSGVATPANFSLTNTLGPPASISATSGTPQSAAVSTAFGAPLVATVEDSGGNPVSGVLVTFTAPTTGASATFAGGVNTATTNASGVATSAVVSANATAGGPYTVMAAVSGVATPANFSLTNSPAVGTSSQFSFYLSGLEAIGATPPPNFYVLAGAVAINTTTGAVTGGEQDYNDGNGITSPQPSGDAITGGTLTVNSTTGQGTLTLITNNPKVGVSGTETLGVQFVNANHALIVQFDGTATSSGSMDLQTLPSTLSGGFSFNFSGVDANYNSVVFGGIFSISGTTLSNGIFDVDYFNTGDSTQTASRGNAFTATVSAPDSFGRGTITNTGIAALINYYVVGPEAIRIIDVDTQEAAVGSAFGQGKGAFSNASLGSFVFGIESNSWGSTTLYDAIGMLTTSPGPGTFQGVGDVNEEGVLSSAVTISSAGTTYSIGSNGYGTLTIPAGVFQDVSLMGIYMTDPKLNLNDPNNTTSGLGGALIANLDPVTVGTGALVPQTDTSTASFAGNYAFGAQDFSSPLPTGWEFDFVGQGTVAGGVLSGTGVVSDPFGFFGGPTTDSGVIFTGTAAPDVANVGRYTMATNPLAITISGGTPVDFPMVIYQASGGQLLWMAEDALNQSLGSLQQQSTTTPFPAVEAAAALTAKE